MAAVAQTNFTAAPSPTDLLRDIKPPVEIPSGLEWLWWTLGALVAIAALLGLALFIFQRRKQVVTPPQIPAHIRAKQALDDALKLLAEPKPFVVAVSSVLRTYLEERFQFRAPERTTEEFLHELQATPLLDKKQKESLSDFLQRCDLVKFAKYEPTEIELRDLHGAAYRLVEETEPTEKAESENRESGSNGTSDPLPSAIKN
ncbi:MAG: hypothetical protein RLY20_683 [Verrucomicrobiota bacterium]|jgi:hypothetical protein